MAVAVSDSRQIILARIRAATADVPPGEEATWRRRPAPGAPKGGDLKARFVGRLRDYGAGVKVVPAAAVGEAVAEALRRRGAGRCAAAAGLPPSWAPPGLELVPDEPPLDNLRLEQLGAAVTGCALAIAETGTLVLAGGPAEGRRALTLLPDLHVCVVRGADIVADVPEAIAALAAERRPVVFVSGPSATSDIELERVEGVHGPRKLEVVVVAER